MKLKNYMIIEAKEGDYMITDMGPSFPQKVDMDMLDSTGKITNVLNRYGVWIVKHGVAKEVIDSGNDLKKLQKKYNVPDSYVAKIGKH